MTTCKKKKNPKQNDEVKLQTHNALCTLPPQPSIQPLLVHLVPVHWKDEDRKEIKMSPVWKTEKSGEKKTIWHPTS